MTITHKGTLNLNNFEIPCYVNNKGERILASRQMQTALKIEEDSKNGKQVSGKRLVRFFNQKSLQPVFSLIEDRSLLIPIKDEYNKRKIVGYNAKALPAICDAILKGRRDGKLVGSRQKIIAEQCEILISAFAQIGIIALIDEATGYIKDKKKEEYKELFYQFVRNEITEKYEKPLKDREDFWNGIYKIYDLKRIKGNNHPQFFGKFLRKYLFAPLLDSNGAILEIIDKKNPVITSKNGKKYRKNAMYQFLEEEVAFEKWKHNLAKLETVLEIATNKRTFDSYFSKAFKIKNTSQDMFDNLNNE